MNTPPANSNRATPLLMLCPLLAVSDTVINALGLSVVAVLVTIVASIPTSVTLRRLPEYGRIAAVVIIVAGVVSSAMLIAHAWFYDLYLAIGSYLPLLVANGLLITRFDVAAPREQRHTLITAGLRTGAVFSCALIALGGVREFVGHGSLFFGARALPGMLLDNIALRVFHPDAGFVLAILPPGAFIAMGLLLAIRQWYRQKRTL